MLIFPLLTTFVGMGNELRRREIGQGVLFISLVLLVVLLATQGKRREVPSAEPITSTATEEVTATQTLSLRPFDPNTVQYEELLTLGMSRAEAVSLLKFRASGKVFRIREDVALCYGISDSAYQVLKHYINIGAEYRITPREERNYPTRERDTLTHIAPTPFRIDTVTVAYLRAIGAFTKRQAEAFIRWRDRSGFRDMEEIRASVEKILAYKRKICYEVDPALCNLEEDRQAAREMARQAITCCAGSAPLANEKTFFCGCADYRASGAGNEDGSAGTFADYMSRAFGAQGVVTSKDPDASEIAAVNTYISKYHVK